MLNFNVIEAAMLNFNVIEAAVLNFKIFKATELHFQQEMKQTKLTVQKPGTICSCSAFQVTLRILFPVF